MACLLIHLIALHTLTTEQYDILLEDNVRCGIDDASFMEQIQNMIDATTTSTSTTTTDRSTTGTSTDTNNANTNTNVTDSVTCHMRYYGWLGSIPNLHWIYNTYIPQYIHQRNAMNTKHSNIIMVPCPIPSDINESHNSVTVVGSLEKTNHNNDNVEDECDEEEDDPPEDVYDIHAQVTSLSLTSTLPQRTQQKKVPSQPMVTPGGTNLVWGTYAYWISHDAYRIILQTLQNDIGAILWKGKRMRYYHVKPIDKVIPRIIRNHWDTIPVVQNMATGDTTTSLDSTAAMSSILATTVPTNNTATTLVQLQSP